VNPDINRTVEMRQRLAAAGRLASRGAGLAYLGTALAAEVLDVVERMHGTIEQRPMPFGKQGQDRTRGITGIVYRGIRNCFEVINHALGGTARQLQGMAREDDAPGWTAVRAAINGVCGDILEARENPLAQPMQLLNHQGRSDASTVVVFIHGLCMSEFGWQRGAFSEFETWCHEVLGARTAHLRYNSGRRISHNGRELAARLEEFVVEEGVERLILIGHSMGGLLIRSACHYAQDLQWPDRLTHVAMLGTPHHGAPLERIGNLANGILKVSPYSRPLSRLGDLRSAGIKDLRFANLIDEDWFGVPQDVHSSGRQSQLPLAPQAGYLLIAATRSEVAAQPPWRSKDDLLVPVVSAWGLDATGEESLVHARIQRELLLNTGHLALLGSPDAMQLLRGWLAPSA